MELAHWSWWIIGKHESIASSKQWSRLASITPGRYHGKEESFGTKTRVLTWGALLWGLSLGGNTTLSCL